MKNWTGILAFGLLLLTACNEPKGQDGKDQKGFQLASLAGLYQDTLPVPNAIGNIVQLTINADSTFSMVERTMYLEQKMITPKSSAGSIQIEQDGQKLKMIPRTPGAKPWWLSQRNGQLVVMDSLGNAYANPGAYQLERISSAVASIGNSRVFSIDKGMVRYPLNLFGRPAGGQISIANYFFKSSPETDLGLAVHYVNSFEGKLEGQDPIALVVGKDSQTLKALSNRVVLSRDGSSLARLNKQETLTSLVINKRADSTFVTYTYLDANDQNWMGKDIFCLKNNTYSEVQLGSPVILK